MAKKESRSQTGQPVPRGRDSKSGPPPTPLKTAPSSEILYGRNVVLATLRESRRRHRQLILASGTKPDPRIDLAVELARKIGIQTQQVDRELIEHQLAGVRHGGIVLETSPFEYTSMATVGATNGPLVVLSHIQDPQNTGSIIRSAEALGASGAILPRDRGSGITPAVVNASSGATERLAIAQVTNLGRSIDSLRRDGWWSLGLENTPSSTLLQDVSDMSPLVIVIGSEGKGIAPSILKKCDVLARIELKGKTESLNASAAAAIALYEFTSRRTNRAADRP